MSIAGPGWEKAMIVDRQLRLEFRMLWGARAVLAKSGKRGFYLPRYLGR